VAQGGSSPGAPAILSEGCAPKFDITHSKRARWLAELSFDSLSVSGRTLERIFCATLTQIRRIVRLSWRADARQRERGSRTIQELYPFAKTGIDNTTALFDPNPAFSDGGDHNCPP
jgi:hypothetical protein